MHQKPIGRDHSCIASGCCFCSEWFCFLSGWKAHQLGSAILARRVEVATPASSATYVVGTLLASAGRAPHLRGFANVVGNRIGVFQKFNGSAAATALRILTTACASKSEF